MNRARIGRTERVRANGVPARRSGRRDADGNSDIVRNGRRWPMVGVVAAFVLVIILDLAVVASVRAARGGVGERSQAATSEFEAGAGHGAAAILADQSVSERIRSGIARALGGGRPSGAEPDVTAPRLASLLGPVPDLRIGKGAGLPDTPVLPAGILPGMQLPFDARPAPFVSEPGPWGEQHMESQEGGLGKWAKPALPPQAVQKVHFAGHAPQTCLPAKLKRVIYDVAEMVGDVRVISTFRDPSRNRRVGGAGRSMHLECRAIDFFVPKPHKDLIAYLKSRPEVGGYKRYPWGFYHIDTGPRRTW